MSNYSRLLLLFALVGTFVTTSLSGQSEEVLSFEDYMVMVRDHHPVTRIAELSVEKGRAYLLKARGGFDPKINTDVDQKYFKDQNYFSLLNGGFKIPTWYGIEVKGAYENNRGDFLNEQNTVPTEGLVSLGIDIPILRGLIIDERRAQLKQAKFYQRATELERRSILNNLFLQSSLAYFNWQEAKLQTEILEQGVDLAENVLGMVKGSFANGAVAAIDTLEALILLQSRQVELISARQKMVLAKIKVSPFLWTEAGDPLELSSDVIPETEVSSRISSAVVELIIQGDSLLSLNPNIGFAQLNLRQQEVEVRLQKEYLKPDIRLNYNPLADFSDDLLSNPVDFNDYKWGISFDMPLLFRKERANYQLAKIEREKMSLKLSQTRLKVQLQFEAQLANISMLREQQKLMGANVNNYNRLVDAEQRKFQVGESSVFLINSRQNKLIESLSKQLANRYKIVENQLQVIEIFGAWPDVVR